MKKNSLIFIISIMMFLFIFSSCSQDSIVDNNVPEVPDSPRELKAFSFDLPSTTNPTLHTDWENVYSVLLNNGRNAVAPWIDEGGSSLDIPLCYTQDIKKEDGWSMLSHTMIRENYSEPDYMILYNRNRGMLKVFYYNPTHVLNQSLVWVLEADNPTSILPSNTLIQGVLNTQNKYATSSNIINNSITNFGQLVQGWNMFMIELPYGEIGNNPTFAIRTYNSINSTIELGGNFSGEVTVNIPQSSSSFLSSLTSLIGSIPKFISGEAFSSVSKAVSYLGKLGSSSFSKSKTNMMVVKGTTSGTIELTGNSFGNWGGAVTPLTNINLKRINEGKLLGLWNLKETPKFNYNKYLLALPGYRGAFEAQVQLHSNNIYDMIEINPDVKGSIRNYSVSCEFFTLGYPYSYKYEEIANLTYGGVATKMYGLKGIVNGEIYRTGTTNFPQSHPGSYDRILLIEHEIHIDVYASVTVSFNFNDGSEYESTRNYKLDMVMVDNWDDAQAKTRRYRNVEYINIW